ncbi:HTH-type transcriptional regulator LutR [Anatilimnocola aggregata]|uniref:HTH-type transcriptional regulator LutR n=1 Tax=Anatilimnocola aggregata TaxID=2528021 RepID=A0A517Y954_9BACT|nr:FCD domain-containing protein [Anatilimnocola aggregata]QDU26764.1 HTH-type transcriptional regulator LutR [Anatilimnocola aggregata]
MPAILEPQNKSATDVWLRVVDRAEELRLQPGDQLPSVRELASHLGLNPNVVRSAILCAQTNGAVRVVPRVGVYLETSPVNARFTVDETIPGVESTLRSGLSREHVNVLHVLEARRVIEVELIGLAAERRRLEDLLPARRLLDTMLQMPSETSRQEYVALDFRFHAELARLGGNDVLASMQRTLTDLLAGHFAGTPGSLDRRIDSERLHIEIYSAVVAGDALKARQAMHEHLSNVYQYLIGFIQHPPEPRAAKQP